MPAVPPRPDRHIALLGAMGSGKSTVGAELAALTGRSLVDTDEVVERTTGRTIAQIFDEHGEEHFRALEHRALADALAAQAPAVIATGGGAVTTPTNCDLLAEHAVVVWLVAPVEVLAARVGDGATRPLLRGRPHQSALAEVLAARAELYRAVADIEVDAATGTPHDVAVAILDQLGAHA